MTSDEAKQKIRKAIERHLKENPGGAMVINPEGLIGRVLEELGFRPKRRTASTAAKGPAQS
jgi:hypothetical protein